MKLPSLKTRRGVKYVLENIHELREMRYEDCNLIDKLIDFQIAKKKAKLSKKEEEIITLRYVYHIPIEDISVMVCLKPDRVLLHLNIAVDKIVSVFQDWDY